MPADAMNLRRQCRSLPKIAAVLAVAMVLSALTGCKPAAPSMNERAGEVADLVLKNARIYTVDAARPWASSVAIRDAKFTIVGDDAATAASIGAGTQVVDLHGRLVLPAFLDAHAHPVWGGLSYSRCPLFEGNTPADYQRLVAKCAAEQPGTGWVYGTGWRDGVFVPEGVPNKRLLDEVAPDRPVALSSVGGHSIWVNSKGLAVAGITRDTPDPPNGRIDRDATGEPIGALQESAIALIESILPPPSERQREAALRYGMKYFNGIGIVGWQDANVAPLDDPTQVLQTYVSMQRKGELRAHVTLALTWDNARGLEQIPDLLATSKRLAAQGIEARTVKFFLDGVLAQRSAALLEPYADQADFSGELQIEPDVYRAAIQQLDAQGWQVHVHAIGDRAIRATVDAFEAARDANAKSRARRDNRHLISHANLIAPEDLPRFAQLGVTVIFQPLWARFDDYMRMTGVRVGSERLRHMYPSASVLRAGGRVAYGSDWAVASANPLQGMEVALTHLEPGANAGEPLSPQERVTLEQAIAGYTLNAAYAMHKEAVTGSIQPGKSADLVVLEHDLFKLPVNQIARTQVLLTLFAGRPVHGDWADLATQ